MREIKDRLHEQVARIGRALSSPKRLEFIGMLCRGEESVETLAARADISAKLAALTSGSSGWRARGLPVAEAGSASESQPDG
jgi:DNA-binding transcriptional ArsR family regulator